MAMAKTITNERKSFRLLVTGGRDYNNVDECWALLDRAHKQFTITHLIHGDARGLDRLADGWALARGVQPVRCPALWDYYKNTGGGKNPAGPIRNQFMAELYPDMVLAFPGGSGTANMVEQALRHGLRVVDAKKMMGNTSMGKDGRSPVRAVDGEIVTNTNQAITETGPIKEFTGPYHWLSNFAMLANPLTMGGRSYPSVEHAYQAAKTKHGVWRQKIRDAESPGLAKKLGRQIPDYAMRHDWDDVKLRAMYFLLVGKFSQPHYKKLLLATGDRELIEGNYHGDSYWGVDLKTGKGQNKLGRLLMKVRAKLREEG